MPNLRPSPCARPRSEVFLSRPDDAGPGRLRPRRPLRSPMTDVSWPEIGPMNGAKVVARAWVDPEYRRRRWPAARLPLPTLASVGPTVSTWWSWRTPRDPQCDRVHAVLVPSMAGAGAAAGLVQGPPYRARMVREPRMLLAEMGCRLPEEVEIRVWDSSAEVRYLVLPQRPPGTEYMTEAELAALVTPDSMIGVAKL